MNLSASASLYGHSRNRTVRLGAALLTVALVSFVGCSSEHNAGSTAPETVSNLPLIIVHTAQIPDLVEAVGTVRAAQSSPLASQVMGNIVDIRVHEGDRVQRGQLLAVIDDAQARAALDQATAADLASQQELSAADSEYVLADATFKRYQALYDKKSVSPQEFDEVKARFQAAGAHRDMAHAGLARAKAGMQQAHTVVGYSRILAPFDGVVTEKKADIGALASPGMTVFTIEDRRRFRLEAAVNETDLRYVHLGQQVPVSVDAVGERAFQGRVVEIVPSADAASRSFLVKLELPEDPAMRSGLFGRAQFSRGERPGVLIPKTAVVERGQLQGVYTVDQNHVASLRYITLGKPSSGDIEVLAGLQTGDMLVTDPGNQELSGKKVVSRSY
jgi:RND family efflux transporter MFP subunit